MAKSRSRRRIRRVSAATLARLKGSEGPPVGLEELARSIGELSERDFDTMWPGLIVDALWFDAPRSFPTTQLCAAMTAIRNRYRRARPDSHVPAQGRQDAPGGARPRVAAVADPGPGPRPGRP